MTAMTFATSLAKTRIERILALLAVRPMINLQLAEALPMSHKWVRMYTQHLNDQKLIHVAAWCKAAFGDAKRYPRAVYALGDKPNARKPSADSSRTRGRRTREKLKSDMDAHDRHLAQRRARRRLPKHAPDPAAAWIRNPIEEAA